VLDNHLHVLVRLDLDDVQTWSDEEVLRRWIAVYPPRNLDLDDSKLVQAWIDHHVQDQQRIETLRERLTNLGWFMKALKEPLSRMANREEDSRGTFWESRYKSIAILDQEALLTASVYIDLNPFAAGLSALPERAKHTSINRRVDHAQNKGGLERLKAARHGTAAGCRAAGEIEQDLWLVPVDDRRHQNQGAREGLWESFSLGSYLQVLDYTSRLDRRGKARLSAGVRDLFERLGTSEQSWTERLKQLLTSKSLRGRYFAGDRQRIGEVAAARGRHHLANLSPQPSG